MSNNPGQQFRNDATPHERLEALFNEQRLKSEQRRNGASTFQQFGQSQASEEGGRWAKPTQVVGSAPAPEYPRQPDGSFSNQAAIVGDEPPYDGDMTTPIVGETWEVQQSIERLDAAPANASGHLPSDDVVAVSATGTAPLVEPDAVAKGQTASMPERGAVPNQSPYTEQAGRKSAKASQQSLRNRRKP